MANIRDTFENEFTSEKYLNFDTNRYDFVGVIKKIFNDADLQQIHNVRSDKLSLISVDGSRQRCPWISYIPK